MSCIKCNYFDFSKYAQTIPRNFGVRYNAYTQTVEVLDSKTQVKELLQKTGQDIIFLTDVMSRIMMNT